MFGIISSCKLFIFINSYFIFFLYLKEKFMGSRIIRSCPEEGQEYINLLSDKKKVILDELLKFP